MSFQKLLEEIGREGSGRVRVLNQALCCPLLPVYTSEGTSLTTFAIISSDTATVTIEPCHSALFETYTMELAFTKGTTQTTGASKGFSRTAKPSSSSSASSWGVSGRFGVRVLMHRDLITCRFFRSLPRSWLKKYWGRFGQESNKHPFASSSSSSSSPLSWSSSPFSLSSLRFSSCSSSVSPHSLRSPVSRLSSPALKDWDREREQCGSASSQALDGHPGFFSTPGMTISPWGPSTAAHTTSSTAASASSLGHSLRHHNSSG